MALKDADAEIWATIKKTQSNEQRLRLFSVATALQEVEHQLYRLMDKI
jgi:hypothetical protein